MGAKGLEQCAHLGRRHKALARRGNDRGLLGIGAGEGFRPVGDAEGGKEFALREQRRHGQAGSAGNFAKRAEIDMGGEVGFAG